MEELGPLIFGGYEESLMYYTRQAEASCKSSSLSALWQYYGFKEKAQC